MELSQEQIDEFKRQIIKQVESTFSEEKKGPAIEKINHMNNEEFIEFLKKNKLLSSDEDKEGSVNTSNEETPFRLIIGGKIPSYKIEENDDGIAVLEINPISNGHTIIIPKKPLSDPKKLSKKILSLASKTAKRIKSKLKPKEVSISPSNVLGETIINILPIYSNESFSSPKKQASKEDLEKLKVILEKKSAPKRERKPQVKKIEESKMWFPKRIP